MGITITKSNKLKDFDGKPLTMAGFPYHALDIYLPKLIRAGQRVAICDQLEAPKRQSSEGVKSQETPDSDLSKNKTEKAEEEQHHGLHR